MAFILFSLVNITIYLLILLYPNLLDWLYLSASRPWGIVTSAFTHADLSHIVNNLEGFVFASLFFVPIVSVYPAKIRRRWSTVFLWLSFLSGILANAVEYPLLIIGPDFNSWGASGVVYGALGLLLAASLISLPANMRAMARTRRMRKGRMFRFDRSSWASFRFLTCFLIILFFLYLIITDAGAFLSAGPGVDVMAHGLGFLFGFLPAMVLLKPGRFQRVRA